MTDRSTADTRPPLRNWQRVLLIVSALVMLVGGAWSLVEAGSPSESSSTPSPQTPNARSTQPSGFAATPSTTTSKSAGESDAADPDAVTRWSPTVFKLGLSCFVGFAIGYALRIFMRITLLVAGVLLLAMFGLQYAGLLTIDWHAMQGHYDSVAGWLGGQFESMRAFITGQLPSAGLASFGMFAGFRRRR